MDAYPVAANISISKNDLNTVLTLRGSFQLEHARPLYEAALHIAAEAGSVVVDCSEAVHLDGGAVQVLLALQAALERAGGSLQVSRASEDVSRSASSPPLRG